MPTVKTKLPSQETILVGPVETQKADDLDDLVLKLQYTLRIFSKAICDEIGNTLSDTERESEKGSNSNYQILKNEIEACLVASRNTSNTADANRRNNCLGFINQIFLDKDLHKHYVLKALASKIITINQATYLLKEHKLSVNLDQITTMINLEDEETFDLKEWIVLWDLDYEEILQITKGISSYKFKKALLYTLHFEPLVHKQRTLFNIIRTRNDPQGAKELMDYFFFNKDSSININSLLGRLDRNEKIILFEELKKLYDENELHTIALKISISDEDDYDNFKYYAMRIPDDKKVEYFANNLSVEQGLSYIIFNSVQGLLEKEVLTRDQVKDLLTRLDVKYPNNEHVKSAMGSLERHK